MSEIHAAGNASAVIGTADRSASVAARQPRSTSPSNVQPLVTTRIGVLFFVTAACAAACGVAAVAVPQANPFRPMLWVTTVAVCSLSGLFSIRSARTLRTIETELRRNRNEPHRWHSARPIIGRDPITAAWNELLREAEPSGRVADDRPAADGDRQSAGGDGQAATLARALRGLPAAWVITDLDGRMVFWSDPSCNLFQLADHANHTGRDLLDLLGLRTGDETVIAKRQRLLSNVQVIHERHPIQVDGERVFLRIARSRLDGRTGGGEGLAWLLTDVSQQELANRSRDQFLQTATEELREPLTRLQRYVGELDGETVPPDQRSNLCDGIRGETHRLGRLLDQLLTVGQMETGALFANRSELRIVPLVQIAADQLRPQANAKRQQLRCEPAESAPTVFADRDKLLAAVGNVIDNAIEYTPAAGEVLVRVVTEGDWVRVDVQDNGPGISAEEQPKVFEKFFRGRNASPLQNRGNGLGLAFTREVVRMHGGDVDLHSIPGEGSTFTIRLPLSGRSGNRLSGAE
jgi:signal transduction histidine kinase